MKVVKMLEDNPITGTTYGAVETTGKEIKKETPKHNNILNKFTKLKVISNIYLRQKVNKENNR